MAKAAPIDDLKTDDPQEWFDGVARVRFEEVVQYSDAALDPANTKGVHDIRVALRRLRSILRDLSDVADKRLAKQLNRSLKALSRKLGKVRDLDVLIEAVEDLVDKAPSEIKESIDRIVDGYREKRAARLHQLRHFLTGEFVLGLRSEVTAVLESAERRRVLADFDNVTALGRRIIEENLQQLLRASNAIYRPRSTKRLHKMRIAGKRLRYAMDLFSPQFAGSLDPFIAGMKQMQSHLGNVNDRDEWIGKLEGHIDLGGRYFGPTAGDHVVWLISTFSRERTEAYCSALALWSDWEKTGFCVDLEEVVKQSDLNSP